jgi:hypothetical protein
MKKILTASLLILISLQSCVANKDYKRSSYDQRSALFDNFPRKDKNKKIKIALQNAEKSQVEKDSGYAISSSSYCQSKGAINMNYYEVWGVVESKAIELGLEKESPILFVCTAKEADFIYEYSYEIKDNSSLFGSIFNLEFFVVTLGIIPLIDSPEYKVSLSIKTKDGVLLKDLGTVDFKHTIYTSTVLLPFVHDKKRVPTKENVIAEIVLDKTLESLPTLGELVNKSLVKK